MIICSVCNKENPTLWHRCETTPVNEPSDFFEDWWTKQGSENDEESKRIAASAFAEGAQYAADSIEKSLKGCWK